MSILPSVTLLGVLAVPPTINWEFGGPLAGLAPWLAWLFLGGLAALGAWAIAFSYFRTLVRLKSPVRWFLIGLRLALLLLVLLALANPTRHEKRYADKEQRPLAVLVDHSDSMTKPDHRGHSRLEQASRTWKHLLPKAELGHSSVTDFAFADDVQKLSAEDQRGYAGSTGQTRFFSSLQKVLEEAPKGGWGSVVSLTDGLDTSLEDPTDALDQLTQTALRSGTRLSFVCAKNLTVKGASFVSVRNLTVPGEVPPKSSFNLSLTIDSFQSASVRLPVRIRLGALSRNGPPLILSPGRHVSLWEMPLSVDTIGILPLEIEVGEGPEALHVRTSVNVTDLKRGTHVLYYEGALDWGRSFLVNVLRREPSFEVASIVHITPKDSRSLDPNLASDEQLKEPLKGLRKTDVLVLANVEAAQFSVEQQKAVSSWVSAGGILLFLAPDNRAASDYAGTEFERLLPVVFAPKASRESEADEVRAYRTRIAGLGYSNAEAETNFAAYAIGANALPELVGFSWERSAREIFMVDGEMPEPVFGSYAKVLRAKAGARVLARHPFDKAPRGDEHAILFAMQRYGSGQVAVLTCDALWRWKMQEPTAQHGVEQFWQELFSWLGRQRLREDALRFDHPATMAELAQPLRFRLSGPALAQVTVSARSEEGVTETLAVAGQENGLNVYSWTPTKPGLWTIEAQGRNGDTALHWVTVRAPDQRVRGELSGLPPDEGVLGQLAARTGGSLLTDTAPADWSRGGQQEPRLLAEQRTPLWWTGSVFLTLLGLYLVDLIARRYFKLL